MFQRARRGLILPFLLPQAVLYTLITIIPIVATVALSLTNWSRANQSGFVGLLNFRLILSDDHFQNTFWHSAYYVVAGGVLLFVPAFFLAWAMHQPIRGTRLFRFLILAPVVLSVSVAGLMWKWMYNPTFGLIGVLLKNIGHVLPIDPLTIGVLGDPSSALTAIIIANLWHVMGTWVLLIAAGFARIPPEIPDAARVDGANDRQLFFWITLPLMWELSRILIVLWIMDALQAFGFVFVMTSAESSAGGPLGSTDVMATYVYATTFQSQNWAYGMALATAMMAFIFVVSMFANRVLRRETVEY